MQFEPQPGFAWVLSTALLDLALAGVCLRFRWLTVWCWLLAFGNAGLAGLNLGRAVLLSDVGSDSVELFGLGAEGTGLLLGAAWWLLEALLVVGLCGVLRDLSRQRAFLHKAARPIRAGNSTAATALGTAPRLTTLNPPSAKGQPAAPQHK
jgi:hypothetical protein